MIAPKIIASDQYLVDNDTTESSLGQYYIAFFGDSSDTSAYEVQFGGHHLGINATLDGTADPITFAPTHLGVQPAEWTSEDGTEVQAFEGIYTDAFAFYDSLTAEQQETLGPDPRLSGRRPTPAQRCRVGSMRW